MDSRLVYGQMIKKYVRRKLQAVRRVILSGSLFDFIRRLRAVGLSGLINTAFVERHNLLLRMSVSPLLRRSWSLVNSELALTRRLELQRGFYHFSKPHGGLRIKLTQPIPRAGRRIPKRYLQQTPMMAAGLSDRILSFEEVLLHPLPEPDILMLSSA